MKSVKRADFTDIGSVAKTHGNQGEVKLHLNAADKLSKWAFLEFQGKPVPFYILHIHGHPEEPILKLEGVDNPDQAKRLIGAPVLVPSKGKEGVKAEAGDDWLGFEILDEQRGAIGPVEEVIELPGQYLLRTTYNGRELLIPAVDEIILKINKKKKQIYVLLPDGLTDI